MYMLLPNITEAEVMDLLSDVASDATQKQISLLLASAYPDRIAKIRRNASYQLANGTGVVLTDETDSLFGSDWLVAIHFQHMPLEVIAVFY